MHINTYIKISIGVGVCSVAQSCLTLCDSMDYSLPGFSVHRIFQVRILVWVAIPFSGNLPNPGIQPTSPSSPTLAGGFFTSGATWETHEK